MDHANVVFAVWPRLAVLLPSWRYLLAGILLTQRVVDSQAAVPPPPLCRFPIPRIALQCEQRRNLRQRCFV
jgi:hypothetical protein